VKDKEKLIYNSYIAVTRSKQNKPFKLRKDFNEFDTTPHYPYLVRLTNFFNRYPHIKVQEFFEAPYEIYTDTAHLPLNYYLTRPAIKAYSLYQQKKQDISPDKQIESIRESLQFIGSFCIKNKLQLNDYIHHKTGCISTWMMHYKEHHINIYSLFEMCDIIAQISQTVSDEKEILLDSLQQNITKFKTRYYMSSVAKNFVKEGTEKLNKFLSSCLTNS